MSFFSHFFFFSCVRSGKTEASEVADLFEVYQEFKDENSFLFESSSAAEKLLFRHGADDLAKANFITSSSDK